MKHNKIRTQSTIVQNEHSKYFLDMVKSQNNIFKQQKTHKFILNYFYSGNVAFVLKTYVPISTQIHLFSLTLK